jgi:hypothetical protein
MWLSFLSGLPTEKRKRRKLVLVQAYADESGMNDGKSTALIIASLIGDASCWAALADEWEWCLRQSPAIHYFKMAEAAGARGEFRGWSENAINEKLISLAAIINRCGPYIAVTGIDLAMHKRSLEMPGEPLHSDPYFFPFHSLIWSVTKFLWNAGLREKFEFIFDEQVVFGLRAKQWYEAFRYLGKLDNPHAYEIMPVEPIFRSDSEILPLQAADMFAWIYRFSAENPGKINPFEWLFQHLKNTRRVEGIENYGPDSLERLMAASAALLPWSDELKSAQAGFQEASKHIRKRKPKKKKR